ncbi:hypothetical protein FRC10_009897 [Ceratobasidium sp. 414]|nr:hypothetical protein FRC10_009897 [Ceratobasidium sp. 414]
MLAVASPPPLPSQFNHDGPGSPVFGPLKPSNGALNNNLDELLKHPLEFKQGCLTPTSGVLTAGIAEGKYTPINGDLVSEDEDDELMVEKPLAPTSPSKPSPTRETLFSEPLGMDWPKGAARHPGFNNLGNTCFLNSVLQCLLHTPPLIRMLLDHKHFKTTFCTVCLLRDLARSSFTAKKRSTGMVLENLNSMFLHAVPIPIPDSFHCSLIISLAHLALEIAKGMRRGRQEDAHEFLRYTVDALQRSALAIYSSTSAVHPHPAKIPPPLAETSWVHAIFGGRLRSRVSCRTCGHCSDTFDSILDLSVDIARVNSLAHALAQFVKSDVLSGEDAYRCEKCKKPVTAEKFMAIHEAPVCLTIHLKRFRPDGRKNAVQILYPEVLDIQQYMSEGQTSKKYVLYGVIQHLGSGPNSGHYTAHVKGADGRWTMMDDELVTSCSNPPVNHKNAYVLFYIQTDKASPTPTSIASDVFSIKRTRDDMEANGSNKPKQTRTIPWDMFSSPNKKARVEGTRAGKEGVAGPSRPTPVGVASSSAAKPLVGYPDDEIEDAGEVVPPAATKSTSPTVSPEKSTIAPTTPSKAPSSAPRKTPSMPTLDPLAFAPINTAPSNGIPPSSFYGSNKKEKDKRAMNPYAMLSGPGNLHTKEQLEIKTQMGFTNFGGSKVKNRMKGKGA